MRAVATGKPFDNAEYDFDMLTTCLRFFCEEAARLRQEVIPDPGGRFLHYTLRQPLGVVVGYLAWNFPLLNISSETTVKRSTSISCSVPCSNQ